MIQFNNVSKIYDRQIVAVNGVSFTIKDGEFVFLIGPSGSGKSTLIKLLVRDEKPSSGSIYFNDMDITKIGRGKVYRLRRQIGVIFQDFKLIQDKTAYENIAFAMEVAGKRNAEIKETVPYVLDIVGLSHRMSAFPRQLSGGEQQRVAIARALANNPKLLIADEPTGNLDPGSAWDIIQILTKINQWGTTVLMSTHGTDIVNTLDKRVIQLDKGMVVRDDAKGKYEMVKKFESEFVENLETNTNVTNIADQQIKITMDESELNKLSTETNKTQIKDKKNKQNFFERIRSKFSITKKKHNEKLFLELPEHHENESNSTEQLIQAIDELTEEKKTSSVELIGNKFVKSKQIQDDEAFDEDSDIPRLKLGSKINKILAKSGIKTIDEIIDLGPDGLAEKTILNTDQIKKIARKIAEFTNENT